MDEKKKTVGSHAYELQTKTPDSLDPIEIEREMHKDYEKHFWEAFETGKKEYAGDFYIVVLTKKEKIMQNVLRNYFVSRKSCPTPNYDQTVYRYDAADDRIDILWVIPDKQTCQIFVSHPLEVVPEERELRDYILDFADGTLFSKMLELNNETIHPGIS